MKSWMWKFALIAAMATEGGCLKLLSEPELEPGTYGPSEPELQRLWKDVLEAAKRDDRQRLTVMMASMRMSQDE
nr:hypothetical protein [Deltaproteobacteria bacterium]